MRKDHQPFIRQRLIEDLVTRSLCGMLVYPATWFSVGIAFALYKSSPVYFYLNLTILLAMSLVRYSHYRWVMNTDYDDKRFKKQLLAFRAEVLIGALHWGAIIAIGLIIKDIMPLKITLFLLALVVTVAGTVVVCIDTPLRLLLPVFMLAPAVYGLHYSGLEYSGFYIFFAACVISYIAWLSYSLYQDYWRALSSEFDARNKAENYEVLAKKFELLSQTDNLTGLYNRLFFNKYYMKEWKLAGRQAYNLTILLLDIDHFKKVNDEHGHAAGDECLKAFASCVENNVQRSGDIVARYGGEEFIVLLLGADENAGRARADKILDSIRKLKVRVENNKTISLTCSIGVATTIPSYGSMVEPEALIHRADLALYSAKQSGRDRVVAHDEKMLRFSKSQA